MSDNSTATGDPPTEEPAEKAAQPGGSVPSNAKPIPVIPKSLPQLPRDHSPDISFTDSDDPEGDAKSKKKKGQTPSKDSASHKPGPSTEPKATTSSAREVSPSAPSGSSPPKTVKNPQGGAVVAKKVVVNVKRPTGQPTRLVQNDLYKKYPWLKPSQPSALLPLPPKPEPSTPTARPGWQQSSLQKQKSISQQRAAVLTPSTSAAVPPSRCLAPGPSPAPKPRILGKAVVAGATPVSGVKPVHHMPPKAEALAGSRDHLWPANVRPIDMDEPMHIPSYHDLATPLNVDRHTTRYGVGTAILHRRTPSTTVKVSRPMTTPALSVLQNINKMENKPVEKQTEIKPKMGEGEPASEGKKIQKGDDKQGEERADNDEQSPTGPSTSSSDRPAPTTVTPVVTKAGRFFVNADLVKRFAESAKINQNKWVAAKPGASSASDMLAEMLRTTKGGYRSRGSTQLEGGVQNVDKKEKEVKEFKRIKKEYDPFAPPPPEKERPPRKRTYITKKMKLERAGGSKDTEEGGDGEKSGVEGMGSPEKKKSPMKKGMDGEGEGRDEEIHDENQADMGADNMANDFNNDFNEDFGDGGWSDNDGGATAGSSLIDVGSPAKTFNVKTEGEKLKLSPAALKAKAKKEQEEKRKELLKPSLHLLYNEEKEALAKSKAQFEEELLKKISKDKERLPALPTRVMLATMKNKPEDLNKAMDRLVGSMKSVGSKEQLPPGVRGELSRHMEEMMDKMKEDVFLGAVRTEVYQAEENMFKRAVNQYVKTSSMTKITEEDQRRAAIEAKWRKDMFMKKRQQREIAREVQRVANRSCQKQVVKITPKGKLIKKRVKLTHAQRRRRSFPAPVTPPGSPPRGGDGRMSPPVSTAGSRDHTPERLPPPATPPGSPPPPGQMDKKIKASLSAKKRLEIQLDDSFDNLERYLPNDEGEGYEMMFNPQKLESIKKKQLKQQKECYEFALSKYNAIEEKGKFSEFELLAMRRGWEHAEAFANATYERTPAMLKMNQIMRSSKMNRPSTSRPAPRYSIAGRRPIDEFTPKRLDRGGGNGTAASSSDRHSTFKSAMEDLRDVEMMGDTMMGGGEEEERRMEETDGSTIVRRVIVKPKSTDPNIRVIDKTVKSTPGSQNPVRRIIIKPRATPSDPSSSVDVDGDYNGRFDEEMTSATPLAQMGRSIVPTRKSALSSEKLMSKPLSEEQMKEKIEESKAVFSKMEESLARPGITDIEKDFFIDRAIKNASSILQSVENTLKVSGMPNLAPDGQGDESSSATEASKNKGSEGKEGIRKEGEVPAQPPVLESEKEGEEGSREEPTEKRTVAADKVSTTEDTVASEKEAALVDGSSSSKDTVATDESQKKDSVDSGESENGKDTVESSKEKDIVVVAKKAEKADHTQEIVSRLSHIWKITQGSTENVKTIARRPMPTTEIERARVVLELREKIVKAEMRKANWPFVAPSGDSEIDPTGRRVPIVEKKPLRLPIGVTPRPRTVLPPKAPELKIPQKPPKPLSAILLPGMKPRESGSRVLKVNMPEPEEMFELLRIEREQNEKREKQERIRKEEREMREKAEKEREKAEKEKKERVERRKRLQYEEELRKKEIIRRAIEQTEAERGENERIKEIRNRQRDLLGGVVVGVMEGETFSKEMKRIEQPWDETAPRRKTVMVKKALTQKEKEQIMLREFYADWNGKTEEERDIMLFSVGGAMRSERKSTGDADVIVIDDDEEEVNEKMRKKRGHDQPGTSKDCLDAPSTSKEQRMKGVDEMDEEMKCLFNLWWQARRIRLNTGGKVDEIELEEVEVDDEKEKDGLYEDTKPFLRLGQGLNPPKDQQSPEQKPGIVWKKTGPLPKDDKKTTLIKELEEKQRIVKKKSKGEKLTAEEVAFVKEYVHKRRSNPHTTAAQLDSLDRMEKALLDGENDGSVSKEASKPSSILSQFPTDNGSPFMPNDDDTFVSHMDVVAARAKRKYVHVLGKKELAGIAKKEVVLTVPSTATPSSSNKLIVWKPVRSTPLTRSAPLTPSAPAKTTQDDVEFVMERMLRTICGVETRAAVADASAVLQPRGELPVPVRKRIAPGAVVVKWVPASAKRPPRTRFAPATQKDDVQAVMESILRRVCVDESKYGTALMPMKLGTPARKSTTVSSKDTVDDESDADNNDGRLIIIDSDSDNGEPATKRPAPSILRKGPTVARKRIPMRLLSQKDTVGIDGSGLVRSSIGVGDVTRKKAEVAKKPIVVPAGTPATVKKALPVRKMMIFKPFNPATRVVLPALAKRKDDVAEVMESMLKIVCAQEKPPAAASAPAVSMKPARVSTTPPSAKRQIIVWKPVKPATKRVTLVAPAKKKDDVAEVMESILKIVCRQAGDAEDPDAFPVLHSEVETSCAHEDESDDDITQDIDEEEVDRLRLKQRRKKRVRKQDWSNIDISDDDEEAIARGKIVKGPLSKSECVRLLREDDRSAQAEYNDWMRKKSKGMLAAMTTATMDQRIADLSAAEKRKRITQKDLRLLNYLRTEKARQERMQSTTTPKGMNRPAFTIAVPTSAKAAAEQAKLASMLTSKSQISIDPKTGEEKEILSSLIKGDEPDDPKLNWLECLQMVDEGERKKRTEAIGLRKGIEKALWDEERDGSKTPVLPKYTNPKNRPGTAEYHKNLMMRTKALNESTKRRVMEMIENESKNLQLDRDEADGAGPSTSTAIPQKVGEGKEKAVNSLGIEVTKIRSAPVAKKAVVPSKDVKTKGMMRKSVFVTKGGKRIRIRPRKVYEIGEEVENEPKKGNYTVAEAKAIAPPPRKPSILFRSGRRPAFKFRPVGMPKLDVEPGKKGGGGVEKGDAPPRLAASITVKKVGERGVKGVAPLRVDASIAVKKVKEREGEKGVAPPRLAASIAVKKVGIVEKQRSEDMKKREEGRKRRREEQSEDGFPPVLGGFSDDNYDDVRLMGRTIEERKRIADDIQRTRPGLVPPPKKRVKLLTKEEVEATVRKEVEEEMTAKMRENENELRAKMKEELTASIRLQVEREISAKMREKEKEMRDQMMERVKKQMAEEVDQVIKDNEETIQTQADHIDMQKKLLGEIRQEMLVTFENADKTNKLIEQSRRAMIGECQDFDEYRKVVEAREVLMNTMYEQTVEKMKTIVATEESKGQMFTNYKKKAVRREKTLLKEIEQMKEKLDKIEENHLASGAPKRPLVCVAAFSKTSAKSRTNRFNHVMEAIRRVWGEGLEGDEEKEKEQVKAIIGELYKKYGMNKALDVDQDREFCRKHEIGYSKRVRMKKFLANLGLDIFCPQSKFDKLRRELGEADGMEGQDEEDELPVKREKRGRKRTKKDQEFDKMINPRDISLGRSGTEDRDEASDDDIGEILIDDDYNIIDNGTGMTDGGETSGAERERANRRYNMARFANTRLLTSDEEYIEESDPDRPGPSNRYVPLPPSFSGRVPQLPPPTTQSHYLHSAPILQPMQHVQHPNTQSRRGRGGARIRGGHQ